MLKTEGFVGRQLGERAVALAIAALGLALLLLSIGMTTAHDYDSLGPAFSVRLTGAILVGAGVFLTLRPAGTTAPERSGRRVSGPGRRVLFMMGACIAYAVLLPVIGYLPSTIATAAAVLYFFGTRRPTTLVLLPLSTALSIYLLFDRLLGIRLP